MKTDRQYRTISKDVLFSRLNLSSTRIKLPRPAVIDTNMIQEKAIKMDCQEKYLVTQKRKKNNKNNKHGNLKSIISRSRNNNGRVTYIVLWQDGTQTQEQVASIREVAFEQFEAYEHKMLNLSLLNPTDYNGFEENILDFKNCS